MAVRRSPKPLTGIRLLGQVPLGRGGMADARASGARGDRPCGFEFRRPDQNVEPGHPHGWPFHVEKRPVRGKTMPRAGRKWREHGPGDHVRRDRSDRLCTGRRDRSRARLQGALRERAEGVAQRPPHPHATSTSPPCLLACFCCRRALKQAALNQILPS